MLIQPGQLRCCMLSWTMLTMTVKRTTPLLQIQIPTEPHAYGGCACEGTQGLGCADLTKPPACV